MSCRLTFQVHLTGDCTLRCRHCYRERGSTYLTREQFDYVLAEALGYMDALALVPGRAVFCGGEPTLSPILFDCIAECSRAGFRDVWLLTNGTVITDEYARQLAAAGCTVVQICIEGNEATHNEIRGGSWNQVLGAWDCCCRAGLRVECQTTVHPLNWRQVDEVVAACRGKTAHVTFLRHVPHDMHLGVMSSAQWAQLMRDLYRAYYLGSHADNPFVRVKDIHWSHSFISGGYQCDCRSRYPKTVIVESNGDVYVCRRSGIALGNLFRTRLFQILTENEILNGFGRQPLPAADQDAGAADVVCMGCPGMALAVHGDMMAEDPHRCVHDLDEDLARDIRERQRRRVPPSFPADAGTTRFAAALRLVDSLRAVSELPLAAAEKERMLRSARARGVSVSKEEVQAAADAFRRACGLHRAAETEAWFRSQQISLEQFHDYLTVALVRHEVEHGDDGALAKQTPCSIRG